ncbi:MAG TPA: BON domain-containing protein [Acidimicrobiales bacterium]|nr:BON domain-containing protein [Acidimicrobiales bacterium]
MKKPNHLLESDVREELDWDPALDDGRIMVKADDGRVTLSGAVPTYADLVEASEDAWSVGGVTLVDNQLLVGPGGELVADADLAARCVAALDADRFVPHGAVTVDAVDGWVGLNGRVRRHFQRLAAKHAVERVNGVLGVTDNVVISNDPIPTDVAERINKALRRKSILDGSVIEVSASDHTIYLDGTTDSWAASQTAEDTAWSAPGVGDVINRLVIVP